MTRLPKITIRLKKPSDPIALGQAIGGFLLLGYSIWLLILLYQTVIRDVYAPQPIDPSQLTANQQQVNKKLLETITTFDAQRKTPTDFSAIRDPFSPL
ncbi:MAG: hypothetical protein V1778_03480 [bacterium]